MKIVKIWGVENGFAQGPTEPSKIERNFPIRNKVP